MVEGGFAKLWFCMVVVVLFAVTISCTMPIHNLYGGDTLRDGETMVSPNGKFELRFFSFGSSKNRYVGVRSTETGQVISILNQNAPLVNTSGELFVTFQGNLEIRYTNGHVVWSTGKLV